MNNKELKRIKVMELLSRGSLTNQQAAELLGLGKRQIIRLKGRYLAYGDEGLVHGNKGRVFDKKISDENREKVIELFNTKYFDFNFSHFTEKLKEQLVPVLCLADRFREDSLNPFLIHITGNVNLSGIVVILVFA